ncbi:sporulation and spore germination protein [Mobilisporobacter senegalensis]|uniref:Sporulation and spore germination protein n=1 Tax=Mobilisporobacter senegalensis TaxID=1329262 RepID=A0A3N1XKF7_9FIRM|nr:GerMN domain-containing protein [Mobilisporobacter senegalensis]ROR27200.1 sporulation and spore germination protein [Mobilisporobacter senegalensis]
MKKFLLVLSLTVCATFLFSCGKQKEENLSGNTQNAGNTKDDDVNSEDETKEELQNEIRKISDYFPFLSDTKYIYEGEGNEYASYYLVTDYIDDNRIQQRSNNSGTETVKIIENKDGNLNLLLAQGETYYRENLLKVSNDNPEILLKEPLKEGTQWTLSDNRKRYISKEDVTVDTPTGTYKALEVATQGDNDIIYDYYAPGVGLVKSVFRSEGLEVTSVLSKIEKNVPFTQTVRFYFPDVANDKIYYVNRDLNFNTNDITKSIFEKNYKEFSEDNFDKVFGPNVKIKSLYLNKDNKVYVDFSKELESEMNAGSGYEAMILQCITNTLGGYYGVQDVYITVEGEPYSSGHIVMEKGESFTVDYNNTIEYK